ncbi:hypothetical protein [Streptomyces canus]|uniref:hypothetical protein n=1 Tax=Streptomyces canus TaxID=58343 RepID=UPI0033AC7420
MTAGLSGDFGTGTAWIAEASASCGRPVANATGPLRLAPANPGATRRRAGSVTAGLSGDFGIGRAWIAEVSASCGRPVANATGPLRLAPANPGTTRRARLG